MSKLLFSLSIILFGLFLGYFIRILHERGRITLPMDIAELRKLLQKIGLLVFMAGSFFLAVWVLKIPDMRLAAMPVLGVGALLIGGALALAVSKMMGHSRHKTGAMFGCGSFTNLGAIGALVCYVFLGEEAFALTAVYRLFEETYYYSTGFPIAKYFSPEAEVTESLGGRLKKVFTDPFVVTILSALFLGALLNITGVPRPEFCSTLTAIMVPVGTLILLCSIGLAMRFGAFTNYLGEAGAIVLIKFLCVPLIITGAAWLLGYGEIEGGLPLKTVLILSSMPVAFNALVPPSLYDLDLELANSCWLVTTLGLVIVLPVLYFAINSF